MTARLLLGRLWQSHSQEVLRPTPAQAMSARETRSTECCRSREDTQNLGQGATPASPTDAGTAPAGSSSDPASAQHFRGRRRCNKTRVVLQLLHRTQCCCNCRAARRPRTMKFFRRLRQNHARFELKASKARELRSLASQALNRSAA